MQLNGVEKKHVKDIVFTNLNLDLPNTGVFLVTGSNGAGKTTLLNIITNITSYKGRVSNPYLNNMSITFQNSYLLNNYTIKEHLDLFAINYKYLSKVNLNDKLDYYPYNLSSGEKQRVANILSLCSDRKLVLLDEPFANLDAKNKRIISSMIKEYKKSKLILIVSHDNYELKNLDGVIFVNQEGAILKKYTKFKYEKIDTCYKRKKTKIKVYHKRKHIKVGLILALIPLIIFLVFNAINVAYYILEKDIHNSVDYNKFYLKSCETLIDGNFEINECENPNLEQLKYIDYGYNYDYLLGYLYKRDDLRVVNNSDIKLHFGEYPKNENEILANETHRVGEIITLKADLIIQGLKTDIYKEERIVKVVGIYENLTFFDDNNLYFDYNSVDRCFENIILKNNKISLKEFYSQLNIESYKYLSFSKIDSNQIISVGTKYDYYKSVNQLIEKIEFLIRRIIVIIVIYLCYQFFKINKVLIVEERKNIFYLMCNSYQCYRFFLIEILLTLLPFVFMLFFQLIFVLVTKLSISALIEGCVLFVVLATSLLSQCLYLQRRNIIGDTMREKI